MTIGLTPAPGFLPHAFRGGITHEKAARGVGAQAVHPGYGFLSERAEFAAACTEHGLIFIGPTAEQIERVGNKLEARRCAGEADVLVAPGGPVEMTEEVFDSQVDQNLKSVFLCSKEAAKRMIARKRGGRIIAIST